MVDQNLEELENSIKIMIEISKQLEEHNKGMRETIIKLQLDLIELAKKVERKK